MLPNFKKTVIAGVVLAATSGLALANGGGFVPPPPHHVSNCYVGAAISRDTGHLEWTDRDLGGEIDTSLQGINGELFVGYGLMFRDRYYLGLEGFGAISSNEGDIFGPAKVEQEWNAGVSLIPGVKVADSTLLYARVGWAISEFRLKNTYGLVSLNDSTRNAIQAGLGLATMVTNNIGIRGEWVWSRYENVGVNATRSGLAVPTNVRLKPITDQFKFGVFYTFNMA